MYDALFHRAAFDQPGDKGDRDGRRSAGRNLALREQRYRAGVVGGAGIGMDQLMQCGAGPRNGQKKQQDGQQQGRSRVEQLACIEDSIHW